MSVVLVGDITQARALQLVQAGVRRREIRHTAGYPPPVEAAATLHAGAATFFAQPDRHLPGDGLSRAVEQRISADGGHGCADHHARRRQRCLVAGLWANDGLTVGQFGIEFVSTRAPGRMLLWAQTDPRQAVKLRDSTLNLLRALAATPLPAETLALARQRVAGQFLLENETYTQQAASLAFYEGLGDAQLACRYIPTVQSVTAEQIQAAMPTKLLAWITLGQHPEGE